MEVEIGKAYLPLFLVCHRSTIYSILFRSKIGKDGLSSVYSFRLPKNHTKIWWTCLCPRLIHVGKLSSVPMQTCSFVCFEKDVH